VKAQTEGLVLQGDKHTETIMLLRLRLGGKKGRCKFVYMKIFLEFLYQNQFPMIVRKRE